MNTVNKTATKIQVGDFVAIIKGWDAKTYILTSHNKVIASEFVEVLATTKCEINARHKNIRCANGETYNIWSDATRYVVKEGI